VIDPWSGEFNCRPFGTLDTTTTSIFVGFPKDSSGNFSFFKGFSGVTCGSNRYRPVLYNFKPIITGFFISANAAKTAFSSTLNDAGFAGAVWAAIFFGRISAGSLWIIPHLENK